MPYQGDPRGAQWHRADLHVHTPASYVQEYGNKEDPATWDAFLAALRDLSADIKIVGINDYFSIEGYIRVKDAHARGLLPNIALVLPVIEIRLEHLAGNADTQRLNFHAVFSNELSSDDIQRGFLDKLVTSAGTFRGSIGHLAGIEEFGRAVRSAAPDNRKPQGSDAYVGFAHSFIAHGVVSQALSDASIFSGRFLTALGFSEFAAMRFDGGGGAIKRELANSVDFLLGNSISPADHHRHAKKLADNRVNSHLIDGSDAHRLPGGAASDRRLGSSMTWLKSDLTFQGVRRAIQRYDDRVFVGDEPPQLARIRSHKPRYIDEVEIRKKQGSQLSEKWFDNALPLNPGLVAVIGNQGSGKSALTDIIALTANAETTQFSFLTPERFRKRTQNKAAEFEATLYWADGTPQVKSLNDDRNIDRPERARYVPQRFFDVATNEIAADGTTTLYEEIEKAVFSHVPPSERQNCTRFRELVEVRTRAVDDTLASLRNRMSEVNTEIANLEELTSSRERKQLTARIQERTNLITALRSNPVAVGAPPQDVVANDRLAQLRASIAELASATDASQKAAASIHASGMRLKQFSEGVARVRSEAEKAFRDAFSVVSADLQGTNIDDIVSISVDLSVVDAARADKRSELAQRKQELNKDDPQSHVARLAAARTALDTETQALSRAQREYEALLNQRKEWDERLTALESGEGDPEALVNLRETLRKVETDVPVRLATLRLERGELVDSIQSALLAKVQVYRELARHVQDFLQREELTRDYYQLDFDLALVAKNAADAVFSHLKYAGPFAGQEDARAWVLGHVDQCEWQTPGTALATIAGIERKAFEGHDTDEERWETAASLLRAGSSLEELYQKLYALEFVVPRYRLGLQGRPLEQLSPGERGILLLIFYLIVDQTDLPLIIDQPEGNLNNQSIYERIVPVIKKAKERRQIIMVSHNPNIVVGCDADQLIHATIDATDGFAVTYESGALESPTFREFTVEKLEGTRPAFAERASTYADND